VRVCRAGRLRERSAGSRGAESDTGDVKASNDSGEQYIQEDSASGPQDTDESSRLIDIPSFRGIDAELI